MKALARINLLGALTLLCVAGAPCSGAFADVFGPISLVSENPLQQVDYAHDTAVSADGRFVSFDGSFGGITGVWRRDLASGAVELVAGGDAQLPSISADGRYISFTTTARLTPGDANESPDVYVRDMDVPSAQACTAEAEAPPCSFTLVSAVEGPSEAALSYPPSSELGARAAGRTAISADGRKVVFVTTAVSNLAGPNTPPMQVALRDLDARTTTLVSAAAPNGGEPKPVSAEEGGKIYGAVYANGAPFRAVESYGQSAAFGASISADGSTVAWLGVNIGQQAAVLPGEALVPRYTEPLWRRIADGPAAPTLRVSGGADPLNPACIASGETALPPTPSLSDPCQGPFSTEAEKTTPGTWTTAGSEDVVPRLSADGYTVALLADAPLVALGANFGRTENHSDLYVVDMHPGLTRVQALRPLTELASGQSSDLATNAPIIDLAISPDGTQLAFTTKRTVFPLGEPAYVSTPAAVPGMSELFEVDLADETLTRVTHGFEGGASEHPHAPRPTGEDPYLIAGDGALSPSFTAGSDTLAFSSTADNLVYGDGNTPPLGHESQIFDGSDAFLVSRVIFSDVAPSAYISPPPAPPSVASLWRLGSTVRTQRDGTVLLLVQVPGAGNLRAAARGLVLVRAGAARSRRRAVHARVVSQTVATRAAPAREAGIVRLTLRLAARYASLSRGGYPALVSLNFSSGGHAALHETIEVTFASNVRRNARARRTAARRRGAGGAR